MNASDSPRFIAKKEKNPIVVIIIAAAVIIQYVLQIIEATKKNRYPMTLFIIDASVTLPMLTITKLGRVNKTRIGP